MLMATTTFYLNANKADKKGRAPIILQCDHRGQRFKYFTGEKIDPRYWSKSKTSYVKPSYNDDETLDNYLKGLVSKVEKIVRDAKTDDKTLTIDYIHRKFLETSNQKPDTSFLGLFDKYIAVSKITKTAGTIKNYENVKNALKAFNSEKGAVLEFELINNSFNEQYVDFLLTVKKFSNNTVGKHVKTLKSFLTWATENNYNRNLEYKKFKVAREAIEIVYLTSEELDSLYNMKLKDQTLDQARDLFCFGCFTGLRFSDIATIEKNNIFKDEIHVRTQKTKDLIIIPLIPKAAAILRKYKNKLPAFSNQKLNLHLKSLAKDAKINQNVAMQRYRGATREDSMSPKHKLITTHTARRTFITLSLEKGIRPEVVMAITGHKDYKTFKAYIKITDEVKKNELLKAWK
jgi:integrase